MRLNDLGERMHYAIFWSTPYRTGNLARNGIGDLYNPQGDTTIGFDLFGPKPGTEYGALLNEAPTIHYKSTLNGKTYTGEYVNVHYGWVDNFFADFAQQTAQELGAVII